LNLDRERIVVHEGHGMPWVGIKGGSAEVIRQTRYVEHTVGMGAYASTVVRALSTVSRNACFPASTASDKFFT
jgi:hypothetical protein